MSKKIIIISAVLLSTIASCVTRQVDMEHDVAAIRALHQSQIDDLNAQLANANAEIDRLNNLINNHKCPEVPVVKKDGFESQVKLLQETGTIEQELRDKLLPVLLESGLDATYNLEGGKPTVDFTYKDNKYWYTAEKDANGIIKLALTRNSKNMYGADGSKMYDENAVLDAVNKINSKYPSLKMYYDRNKGNVYILQYTLLSSISLITKDIIEKSLYDMKSAWEGYDRVYRDLTGQK